MKVSEDTQKIQFNTHNQRVLGSSPIVTTNKNLIIFIFNRLGFFSVFICTIIIRLTDFSLISIRILAKK